ncbi:TPA: Ig-like domain repeat protein [Enterobacter kobei]|nr:Ig-like domain repeat protein [Enterobacter kobei]
MSTQTINIAVVDGKRIVEATSAEPGQTRKAVRVKAVADGKYILAESESGVAPENITVRRDGQDLHVALEGSDPSQPEIIIEGFFDAPGQLVGVAENGTYYPYISSGAEGEAAFLLDDAQAPLVLGSEALTGFGDGLYTDEGVDLGWLWPLLLGLGGLALLGAAYAAGLHEGRRDHNHGDNNKGDNGEGGGDGTVLTPKLESVEDNVGDKKGPIDNGGTTDDNRPTLGGEGTPGGTIEIIVDDKVIGEVEVGEDGKWTFEPELPLEDGKHEIIIIEKDPDGNESRPTDPHVIIVDTTAPGRATIDGATDDQGAITGEITNGGVTDDAQPAIRGTAEPGSTVIIYHDGKEIGRAPVDEAGNWVFTPEPALAEGTYNLTAAAMDEAGNIGLPSEPFSFEVDLTPPVTPGTGGSGGIDAVFDNVDPRTGNIEDGGHTDDTTPTLSGGGQTPGDIVIIRDGEEVLGSAKVGEDGSWEFTTPELGEGRHDFDIIVQDPAGNQSEPSEDYTIIIDKTPPAKPVLTEVFDGTGDDTGALSAGDVTDDSHPDFKGTAEPGSVVYIYSNGNPLGSAQVNERGEWTFTPELPLAVGPHDITVKAVDEAGNESEATDPFSFELIAGGAPAEPVITHLEDDVGSLTGKLAPNGTTDDKRPDIVGTGAPGSTIVIRLDGREIGTATVDGDGNWTFPMTEDLAEGLNNLTATARDAAGNESSETSFPINLDSTAPGSATDVVIEDNVGAIQDPIIDGTVTDDNTPTLRGKAEPGTTVIVRDGDKIIGTAPVDDAGNWTLTSPVLEDGTHSFTTEVVDDAGNSSGISDPVDFEVDTSAVVVSLDRVVDNVGPFQSDLSSGSVTDDKTPDLFGKATPGGTVTIYDGDTVLGTARVDGSGNWSFPLDLEEGTYNLQVTVTTDAKGESDKTSPFMLEVDLTAPGKPGEGGRGGIDFINDNVGADQGDIGNGGHTDDPLPELGGAAQTPGDTVLVYDNGALIGSAKVGTDGSWRFPVTENLIEGEHRFTIVAQDPAGNRSEASDEYVITTDYTAPAKPVITQLDDDAGRITDPVLNGGVTDDTRPAIRGTTEAGTRLFMQYQQAGGSWSEPVEVTVNADGSWSWTPPADLAEGDWSFRTQAVDKAGNRSLYSDEFIVEVDTTPPEAPSSVARSGDMVEVGLTDTEAEAGDTVYVNVGGDRFSYVLTQENINSGKVNISVPTSATGDVNAFISDKVGNYSNVRTEGISFNENFNGFSSGEKIITGSSRTFDFFTLKHISGPDIINTLGSTIYRSSAIYVGRGQSDTSTSEFEINLNGGVSDFSFNYGANDIGALSSFVDYYDQYGELIARIELPRAPSGDGNFHNISYTTSEGRLISKISFKISDSNGVVMDDFNFSKPSIIIDNPESSSDYSKLGANSKKSDVYKIEDLSLLDDSTVRVNGAEGCDILKFTGSDQVIDLTALGEKIRNVEIIDLTGSGDNTLKLSLSDVLADGEADLFFNSETDAKQMMIRGNEGDVVDLQGKTVDGQPESWSGLGKVTVEGVTYDVYRHTSNEAELLIQQGVQTNFL